MKVMVKASAPVFAGLIIKYAILTLSTVCHFASPFA
jgi:hypothetical protein